MTTSDIQIIQRAYAAFERGDLACLIGMLSPEMSPIASGPAEPGAIGSLREEVARVGAFFEMLYKVVGASEHERAAFHAADGKVFVVGNHVLPRRGTMGDKNAFIQVFDLRDGKIAGFREFQDSAAIAAAWNG